METNSYIAYKYPDILSSSILIRPGRPAVYQLSTKKETFGTLTRTTVGEKDEKKINKTILLVGETGAGKSSLIDALFNYSMGVEWEDGVWFQIVEEEHERQTQSQTSDVMVYQIFEFKSKTLPYSLTIIDTPGFGDTRGIEHDVAVSQKLFDLFRSDDGVHEVHAVGVVMKGSDNRVYDRLSYVYNSVTSLFGKNMEKIIVALITHSDGIRPRNVLKALEKSKIKCATNEKGEPIYFLFNNCQHEDRTVEVESLENAERITQRGLNEFTAFLENTGPQKLMTTTKVLNDRIGVTACVENLKNRIELTELKQTEIRQIQEGLKKHEEEMKKNQLFTVEVDEVYKEKEDIVSRRWGLFFYEGAVNCKVCEETCHYPGCTMALRAGHCEVIKRRRCTVCTNKCPAVCHVKENWRYVNKTRRVKKTSKELKQLYENRKTKSMTLLQNVEAEMKKLTLEKSNLLDAAYQHVERLEQIALNVDSVSTYVHFDFLIEKMEENRETEKVQKLEEMKRRMDEGTRSALEYMFSKLTAADRKIKE